jgi:hypothetical protein
MGPPKHSASIPLKSIKVPDLRRASATYLEVLRLTLKVEPIASSDDELEEMLRTAAARTGIGERRFDRGSPRLFALMAVAAQPCLSIRPHRYLRITPDDLVSMGTLDLALRHFLRASMLARRSCIIRGGTGAGKTTLLRNGWFGAHLCTTHCSRSRKSRSG